MQNKVKNIAFLGMCTAVALGLAYIEALLPPVFAAVPGIKMGLANSVCLLLVLKKDIKGAFLVNFARILLSLKVILKI